MSAKLVQLVATTEIRHSGQRYLEGATLGVDEATAARLIASSSAVPKPAAAKGEPGEKAGGPADTGAKG